MLRAFAAPLACLVVVFFAAAAAQAVEHPANGQLTRDVPLDYGTADYGLPAGVSRGDLTFGGLYPPAATLAPPERYMLAGTVVPGDPAAGLPAWITSVTEFCLDYQQRYGLLPATLTPEAVTALRETAWPQLGAGDQALPFNPLTGLAPRLDARQFTPGDLYVRALTADEMRYFADRRPELATAWYSGPAQLASAVLYVRAYGATGVIYENLAYRLGEPNQNAAAAPQVYAKAVTPVAPKGQPKSDCTPSGG